MIKTLEINVKIKLSFELFRPLRNPKKIQYGRSFEFVVVATLGRIKKKKKVLIYAA